MTSEVCFYAGGVHGHRFQTAASFPNLCPIIHFFGMLACLGTQRGSDTLKLNSRISCYYLVYLALYRVNDPTRSAIITFTKILDRKQTHFPKMDSRWQEECRNPGCTIRQAGCRYCTLNDRRPVPDACEDLQALNN